MATAFKSSTLSYVRNVGKSLGYATLDVLKDRTPYLTSVFKESSESAKEIYQSIKDFKSGKQTDVKSMGKEALDNLFKNTINDLKTGNYYNKERDEVFDNEMMKMMGLDFEDGEFSFDDNEFEFGSESSTISDGEELIIKQNAKNSAATIMAVDKVGAKVSYSINRGTAASAKYIVSSSRVMNKAMMDLNSKGFATVTEAIATLNKNTIQMNEMLVKPLTTFMQNGTIFFTKATDSLDKLVRNTEELLKLNGYDARSTGSSSSRKRTISDIMSANGGISISAYKDLVGGNIKEATELLSILGIGKGKGNIANLSKGISPLRYPLKWLVGSVMPAMLLNSLGNFDKALKDFIPSAMARAMTSKGGGLLGTIFRSILLPKNDFNPRVSTKYNQGPIPFDGQTKKAITEVIPLYLSHILSAINGSPATRYDYQRGTFTKISDIHSSITKREKSYAEKAGGDFRHAALSSTSSAREKEEIEKFFLQAFLNGENITDLNRAGFETSAFGKQFSKSTINKLRKLAASGKYNKIPGQMMLTRSEYNKIIRDLEAQGNSIDTMLVNRSDLLKGNGRAVGNVDKYGNSSLDYLRGIYYNTLGGGSGKGKRVRGTNSLPSNVSLPNLKGIVPQTQGQSTYYGESIDINDPTSVENHNKKVDKNITDIAREIDRLQSQANLANSAEKERLQTKIDDLYQKVDIEIDSYINVDDARLRGELIVSSTIKKNKFNRRVSDVNEKSSNFIKKTLGKVIPAPLMNLFNRPIEAFSGLLDKLTNSMTTLLWGDGTKDGMFTMITKGIKNAFTNNETVQRILGIVEPKKLWENTKTGLRSYWNWVKSGFTEKWDQRGSTGARYMDINPGAANGRRITKGGMIAVSEGEMVIPAEFNPFYNKTINKREQYRQEAKAANDYRRLYGGRILGSYAGGTVYVNSNYGRDDIAGYRNDEQFEKIKANLNGPNRDKWLDWLKRKYNPNGNRLRFAGKNYYQNPDGSWDTMEQGSTTSTMRNAFRGARDIVSTGIHNISNRYGSKTKENINKFLDTFGDDIKASKGRIGAGAVLGTLGGGMFGMPLVGLMLGSAAGFVSKSEKAQKMLFGDYDPEKDEYEGGVLSPQVSKFLNKIAPDMARGGSVGAISGALLVGGPLGMIGGLTIGTALGYARKSEKAQEFLFGKFDENGELVKKGLIDKKKLEAGLPKAIVGAGIGAIIGPAGGLFTNMVLGAGLGFLTQNKKVHDFLFGNEEDKKPGLLYKIGDKLIGGIDDLLHNTANHIKVTINNIGKNILTKVGNIREWFTRRRARKEALKNVEKTKLRKFGEALGSVGKGLGIGAAGVVASPFLLPFAVPLGMAAAGIAAPKAFANARKRKNARRGYNIYDYRTDKNGDYILDERGRRVKGNLTAAERVRYRNNHKILTKEFGKDGNWEAFDEHLANLKTQEERQEFLDLLNTADESSRDISQLRNRNLTDFYGKVDGSMNSADMSRIAGMIKSGDVEKLQEFLANKNYDPANKESFIEYANNVRTGLDKKKDAQRSLMTRYNFKGGKKDLTRAQDLVKAEMKAKTPEQLQAEYAEKASKLQEQQLTAEQEAVKAQQDANAKLDNIVTSLENGVPIVNEVGKKNKKHNKTKQGKSKVPSGIAGNVVQTGSNSLQVFNADADPLKMNIKNNGDIEPDMRDKTTKEEIEDENQVEESQKKTSGLLTSIKSGIESFKDRLFGSKDEDKEKGSIFDKIKSIGKTLLFTGGIIAGVKLLPGLLPTLGNVFKWLLEKGPSIFSGIINVLSGIGTTIGSILGKVVDIAKGVGNFLGLGSEEPEKYNQDEATWGSDADVTEREAKSATKAVVGGLAGGFLTKKIMGFAAKKGIAAATANAAANGLTLTGLGKFAAAAKAIAPVAVVAAGVTGATIGADKNIHYQYGGEMIDYGENKVDVKFSDGSVRTCYAVAKTSAANRGTYGDYIYKWLTKEELAEDGFYNAGQQNAFWHPGKSPLAQYPNDLYADRPYFSLSKQNGQTVFTFYRTREDTTLTTGIDFIDDFRIYGSDLEFIMKNSFAKKAIEHASYDLHFGTYGPDKVHSLIEKEVLNAYLTSTGTSFSEFSRNKEKQNEYKNYAKEKGFEADVNNVKNKPTTVSDKHDSGTLSYADVYSGIQTASTLKTENELLNKINAILIGNIENIANDNEQYRKYVADIKEKAKKIRNNFNTNGKPKFNNTPNIIIEDNYSRTYDNDAFYKFGDEYEGNGSGLFGKGFVSQLDPRYANRKYGTTNIADAGCAPAVASMAASALGKNLSMPSAMNIGKRFADSRGTDSSYFGSALGSRGISTAYLNAKGTISKLANNEPVIMLGRDSSNTSKSNSPFGPTPHYVLGRGFDRNGNVIIDDPEMSGPTRYSPSVLGSVKAAIAGKASGLRGKGTELRPIKNSTFSQADGKYRIEYEDGTIINSSSHTGITSVRFDQNRGKYLVIYSDGKEIYSKDKPKEFTGKTGSYIAAKDYSDEYEGSYKGINGIRETTQTWNANTSSGNILSKILGLFSTGLNALFSGEDANSAVSEYMGQQVTSSYNGGYNGGINGPLNTISASSFTGKKDSLTNQKLAMVQDALSREKTEIYNQSLREQNRGGVQYSDCSSFASRMYKKHFGIDIGGNTESQWTKLKAGNSPMTLIDNSKNNRPNYSFLQPGDLVYWGNNSSHTDNVGHVEMYAGENRLIGQDAGTGNYGPRVKNYDTYRLDRSVNYLGAARLIGEDIDPEKAKYDFGNNSYKYAKNTNTAKMVYAYLYSHGYSPAAAAGIMGNMYQESGVNPNTIQKNGQGPAAGIVQWENWKDWKADKNNKSRFADMANYAASKGKDWTDLMSQLEFMDKEMNYSSTKDRLALSGENQGAYINEFSKVGLNESDATSLEGFKSLKDPAKAAKYFEAVFERASKPNMKVRESAAEEFYDLYGLGKAKGSGLTSNAYNRLIGSASSAGSRTNYIPTSKTNNIILAGKGSKSDMMLEQLVSAILNVLTRMLDNNSVDSNNIAAIRANSENIGTITELLGSYNNLKKEANKKSPFNPNEVDDSFKAVVNEAAALAKGY